ncbi:MAG: hypothetical protein J5742_04675 [Alphaproteobacteria bacterium]|nr:hypothetical protein [Alphaproteobacteria bacterium]
MKYKKTLEEEIKTSEKYLENQAVEILECGEHELGYHDGLTFALREYKKRVTSRTIEHIIRKFVRRNFGDAEAKDPSWNIKLLAAEIANNL